jgi:D-glycero-D-manno-heptose 1,7-bisphosphate phosphatase
MKSRFPKLQFSYCIHDDRDQCPCRKPKPGMILDLVRTYGLNKEKALLIGDSGKDIEAGRAAGVRTMLLRTDYNRQYHSHSTIGRLCEIVL